MVDLQRAYIAFERNLLNLTVHCSRPTTSPPFPASRTTGRDPTTYIPRVRRCHPAWAGDPITCIPRGR
jgi:hypothetical protein